MGMGLRLAAFGRRSSAINCFVCCSNYQSRKIDLIFAEAKSSYMGTTKFEFSWLVMLLEQNMPNLY